MSEFEQNIHPVEQMDQRLASWQESPESPYSDTEIIDNISDRILTTVMESSGDRSQIRELVKEAFEKGYKMGVDNSDEVDE